VSGLMTARAVGELLGVSAETVLRWVRAGKLPAYRLPGGAIRFREEVLEEWLTERGTCPNTQNVLTLQNQSEVSALPRD
jgi:excisionase family DNA binding protein